MSSGDVYCRKAMALVREAGRISLEQQGSVAVELKKDRSVVTPVDRAIADQLRAGLGPWLDDEGHVFLDEENESHQELLSEEEALVAVPYLWVVDPIDGTRNYGNGLPLFGVSLGILRFGRPWIGVVYLPALRELFYGDGEEAWFVREAFTTEEKKTRIHPVSVPLGPQSVLFGNDLFFQEFDWDFQVCPIMLPSCAVVDLCWPAVGRGSGTFFNASIWDFAGSWPIFEAAGMTMRSLASGEPVEALRASLFQGRGLKPWQMKEHYVVCSSDNYERIRSVLKFRRR